MSGFYTFIAVASLISVLITYILSRFFKNRIVKYIPSIIAALTSLGFYVKSRFFANGSGFDDLGYIVLMFIAGIVFLISLITAISIELINRNKRPKY